MNNVLEKLTILSDDAISVTTSVCIDMINCLLN